MSTTELLIAQTAADQFTKSLDYDGNGNMIYLGRAVQGTEKSVSAWQIIQFTYDGNNRLTDVKWCDGNTQFDNIWDNRASLSYS